MRDGQPTPDEEAEENATQTPDTVDPPKPFDREKAVVELLEQIEAGEGDTFDISGAFKRLEEEGADANTDADLRVVSLELFQRLGINPDRVYDAPSLMKTDANTAVHERRKPVDSVLIPARENPYLWVRVNRDGNVMAIKADKSRAIIIARSADLSGSGGVIVDGEGERRELDDSKQVADYFFEKFKNEPMLNDNISLFVNRFRQEQREEILGLILQELGIDSLEDGQRKAAQDSANRIVDIECRRFPEYKLRIVSNADKRYGEDPFIYCLVRGKAA